MFEKIRRKDTVSVIPITSERKIIITNKVQPGYKPFIGFPGGWMDEKEDPLFTAKRELIEETGMEAKKRILWSAIQPIGSIDWTIYRFIAKGCRKISDQTPDPREIILPKKICFEELEVLVRHEKFRDLEMTIRFLRGAEDKMEYLKIKQLFTK